MVDAELLADLVDFIAKHLVDRPEEVSADADVTGDKIRISLYVAAGDEGRVIGKDGRIIQAIRQIAIATAARRGKKVTLDLVKSEKDG